MSLIEDLLAGAIGYGIAKAEINGHSVRNAINKRFSNSKQKISLEDLIDEYARRYEIYTQKNEFSYQLHQIARRYEEFDYEEVYGRG